MLIYHYTDLRSALNIISTKEFIACSNNVYNGDSGLNSFPTLKGGFNYRQNFNKTGVVLVFDWLGEVEENVSINFPTYEMKRNVMYIQGAWRSFIPVGSDPKFLKAIKIIYDDKVIDELIECPFYYHLIPNIFSEMKYKLYSNYKTKVDNKFIELFENKTINISVV